MARRALDETMLRRLWEASVDAYLPQHRDTLLSGISPWIRFFIRSRREPGPQLLADLEHLNRHQHALQQWFDNAAAVEQSTSFHAVLADARAALDASQPRRRPPRWSVAAVGFLASVFAFGREPAAS